MLTAFQANAFQANAFSALIAQGGRPRPRRGGQMIWRPLELPPVIVEARAVLLTETFLAARGVVVEIIVVTGCVLATASWLQARARVISWGKSLLPIVVETEMRGSQFWPYEEEDLELLGLGGLNALN